MNYRLCPEQESNLHALGFKPSRSAVGVPGPGFDLQMIPDGLEPSLPGCRPGVVAAGPRDRVASNTHYEKWTHRESHPDLRFAGPASSCWTMSPCLSAEAVGLEPTNGFHPPPVFRTGSSSGRMTSISCGGWNRTNALLVQSQALLPAATTPQCSLQSETVVIRKVRGEGVEPPQTASKAGGLPLADPRSL